MSVIRQWVVQNPHGSRADREVFDTAAAAWDHAAAVAESPSPVVITYPNGCVYYLLRQSELVEVSTRHRHVGTTRRVVEP